MTSPNTHDALLSSARTALTVELSEDDAVLHELPAGARGHVLGMVSCGAGASCAIVAVVKVKNTNIKNGVVSAGGPHR